eukprot:TRINITY_DN1287_c0_g1_i1.p1 TRINITY_DN1287_c0_g1~~TRINITY_DN1287_c0_g1_i1.p1  ORF type:complete len:468 (+),score=106.68 TRINITY_DN1287_c0_g1_i1:126-1529(+)
MPTATIKMRFWKSNRRGLLIGISVVFLVVYTLMQSGQDGQVHESTNTQQQPVEDMERLNENKQHQIEKEGQHTTDENGLNLEQHREQQHEHHGEEWKTPSDGPPFVLIKTHKTGGTTASGIFRRYSLVHCLPIAVPRNGKRVGYPDDPSIAYLYQVFGLPRYISLQLSDDLLSRAPSATSASAPPSSLILIYPRGYNAKHVDRTPPVFTAQVNHHLRRSDNNDVGTSSSSGSGGGGSDDDETVTVTIRPYVNASITSASVHVSGHGGGGGGGMGEGEGVDGFVGGEFKTRRTFEVGASHIRFVEDKLDKLFPQAAYTTILRNPETQVVSAGHFWSHGNPPNNETFLEGLEYLAPSWGPTDQSHYLNPQCFDLGVSSETAHLALKDPSVVTELIARMDARMRVVLILEFLDDSLVRLKRAWKWDLVDVMYASQKLPEHHSAWATLKLANATAADPGGVEREAIPPSAE